MVSPPPPSVTHHLQSHLQRCPRLMDAQSSDSGMSTITSTEPSPPPPQHCPAKQSPILLAKLQGCPMGYGQQQKPKIVRTESPTTLVHPSIPAGTTITAVTRPVQRKLDSPTDSGIESGSDGSIGKICSGSSSCSSPRSSLEDHLVTPSLAESLPTLKRALEKPAIFDPHMYHKKFRRVPACDEQPSQLQTILTAPRAGLAMTHSNLVDRLKMAPKMSDEHRKNQEILNRFIDQGGVIKSTAKVHMQQVVDNEGAPLNLSKKTTTIVIGNGSESEQKILVEA